jgi:CHAT domain-containing protein/tetratricopeptide (TPR) repeat protein
MSTAALTDLGLMNLLAGRSHEAVRVLEEARSRAPDEASLLNDLAVAYLSRADRGGDPYDFVRALTAAEEAVRSKPELVEALFNRALLMQELALEGQARAAWGKFLRSNPDPGWAREAESQLRRLGRSRSVDLWQQARVDLQAAVLHDDQATIDRLTARFAQPARTLGQEWLLSRWAEQRVRGQIKQADLSLQIADAIGSSLAKHHRDGLLADTVGAILAAQAESAPRRRLEILSLAHASFGRGLRHYQAWNISSALPDFVLAERLLRDAGSPFADWASLYLASCAFHHGDFDQALRSLRELRRNVARDRYPILVGRIDWVLAAVEVVRGSPGEALPVLREARDSFRRAHQAEDLAAMEHQLGLSLIWLGSDAGWTHIHRALRLLPEMHSPNRVFALFDEAGIACQQRGNPEIGHYFHREMLTYARRTGGPELVVYAHLRSAQALNLARREGALEDLERAAAESAAIVDESIRARARAEIRMVAGEAVLRSRPAAAAAILTHSVRYFESSAYKLNYPTALFLRARAYFATGQTGKAERDFRAGLQQIESAGKSVTDLRLRTSYYDLVSSLFDEVVAFRVKHGDGAAAFLASEQARTRTLLTRVRLAGNRGEAPFDGQEQLLSSAQIRHVLPERTAVVKYVLLADRLLIWTLTRDTYGFHQVRVSADVLDRLVVAVRNESRQGVSARLRQRLRRLYSLLVRPVEGLTSGVGAIIFVPDKSLHLLPFAALANPRTNRYLVEDHAIAVAPSANVYAGCVLRDRQLHRRELTTALTVVPPAPDRQRFPELLPLPHALDEAREIAALYPRTHQLVGRNATKRRFGEQLSRPYDVVHFAGHATLNLEFPEFSSLLLAGEGRNRDSGVVYSHEVFGLRLARTRLVVLSACSTGAGRISASEGATSLARAFLATGSPAVVATLWKVEDRAALQLLKVFHRRLRAGDDPMTALRSAQRAVLQVDGAGFGWAGFQLIGGVSPKEQG